MQRWTWYWWWSLNRQNRYRQCFCLEKKLVEFFVADAHTYCPASIAEKILKQAAADFQWLKLLSAFRDPNRSQCQKFSSHRRNRSSPVSFGSHSVSNTLKVSTVSFVLFFSWTSLPFWHVDSGIFFELIARFQRLSFYKVKWILSSFMTNFHDKSQYYLEWAVPVFFSMGCDCCYFFVVCRYSFLGGCQKTLVRY